MFYLQLSSRQFYEGKVIDESTAFAIVGSLHLNCSDSACCGQIVGHRAPFCAVLGLLIFEFFLEVDDAIVFSIFNREHFNLTSLFFLSTRILVQVKGKLILGVIFGEDCLEDRVARVGRQIQCVVSLGMFVKFDLIVLLSET